MKKQKGLSRRAFIGSTAAGAVAFGKGSLEAQEKKQQRPSEDDVTTNINDVKDTPRTETSMPGKYPAVVAEAHSPKAVSGKAIDAGVVRKMLDTVMIELTGAAGAAEAWKSLFTPGERVGIKINPIGGKLLSNTHEVVRAIIDSLMEIGFKKDTLLIWDRRQEQMAEAGFTEENYPGIKCIGTEYIDRTSGEEVWKGEDRLDKDIYYEFDIVGEYDEATMPYMINGGTKSYFTKILTQMVDKVINVPVLKNAGSGVTLALKNMAYGVTSNTARGHKIWNRYIAEVCAFPAVRDKTVLNIIDGLRGCYEGGPGAVARYIWNANTLWAATDPVAVDRIAWDTIFNKRVEEGIAEPEDWEKTLQRITKLDRSEKLGLGTADTTKITHRKKTLA